MLVKQFTNIWELLLELYSQNHKFIYQANRFILLLGWENSFTNEEYYINIFDYNKSIRMYSFIDEETVSQVHYYIHLDKKDNIQKLFSEVNIFEKLNKLKAFL